MQTEIGDYVKAVNYEQVKKKEFTVNQRNLVKDIIRNHPEGITDLEICVLSGISRSSVTARRNEIRDVIAIGIAKIHDEFGDRLNILWGLDNGI